MIRARTTNARPSWRALRALGSGLLVSMIVVAPQATLACSVCTAGRDEENQLAFLLSTIFMSALPLLALGTLVFVLWRRMQKLEQEREASRAARPVPATLTAPVSGPPA